MNIGRRTHFAQIQCTDQRGITRVSYAPRSDSAPKFPIPFGRILNNKILLDQNIRLIRAAKKGDLDTLNEILGRGIDIHQKDHYGNSAFHYACLFGRIKAAKLLLLNGSKINEPNEQNLTPIKIAVMLSNKELFKLLLDRNVTIDNDTLDYIKKNGTNTLIALTMQYVTKTRQSRTV
ncbi:MAG: ankyrin repeat domain-containing protein [Candidatus Micrarchaeota archaeon]